MTTNIVLKSDQKAMYFCDIFDMYSNSLDYFSNNLDNVFIINFNYLYFVT